MKRYIRASSIANNATIRLDIYDSYGGWAQGAIVCYYEQTLLGSIDIQVNDDEQEIYINMIEVNPEYRRQGIATRMFDYLKFEFPNFYVEWGFTTADGEKLRNALTVTIENEEYTELENRITEIDNQITELEAKFDDDWLNSVPKDEYLMDCDMWQSLYDEKKNLDDKLSDIRKYITVWK